MAADPSVPEFVQERKRQIVGRVRALVQELEAIARQLQDFDTWVAERKQEVLDRAATAAAQLDALAQEAKRLGMTPQLVEWIGAKRKLVAREVGQRCPQ